MNTESKMLKRIKQSPIILRNLMIVSVLLLLCLIGCSNKGVEEVGLIEDGGPSTPETDLLTATPEPDLNPTPSDGDIFENDTGDAVNLCIELSDAFNRKIWDTSGWVHGINDRMYFNNVNGAYDPMKVEEFWYRFDPEGFILEGYNWSGTQDGEIQQEGVWLNGWYDGVYVNAGYNLEYDFDQNGDIQRPHTVADAPIDYSDGFCVNLTDDESASMNEMVFQGQAARQFTYESVVPGGTLIKAIYFSQEDGMLLGFDSNLVQPDGSVQLISEVVYRVFEFNADPPEERFAEIWARVPHGEDFVPVEENSSTNSDPEAIASQCQALADAFNRKIWDTSGWVHGINDRMYFNNVNGAYDPMKVEEFWYRFDPEGFILEGYNWSGYEGEEIQPEGIWLNGWTMGST